MLQFLYVRHPKEGILESQGRFDTRLALKPANLKRRQEELRSVAAEMISKDKRIRIFASDADHENSLKDQLAKNKLEHARKKHSEKTGLGDDGDDLIEVHAARRRTDRHGEDRLRAAKRTTAPKKQRGKMSEAAEEEEEEEEGDYEKDDFVVSDDDEEEEEVEVTKHKSSSSSGKKKSRKVESDSDS